MGCIVNLNAIGSLLYFCIMIRAFDTNFNRIMDLIFSYFFLPFYPAHKSSQTMVLSTHKFGAEDMAQFLTTLKSETKSISY